MARRHPQALLIALFQSAGESATAGNCESMPKGQLDGPSPLTFSEESTVSRSSSEDMGSGSTAPRKPSEPAYSAVDGLLSNSRADDDDDDK